MSDRPLIPENLQRWIRIKAKVFCRKPEDEPDIVLSHKEYSLLGLYAYHEASKEMYYVMRKQMENEMRLYRACDPRRDKIYEECQELFIQFITKWKLGETNSGLGAVLEEKFHALLAFYVKELLYANQERLEYLEFIIQVANDDTSPLLKTQALGILSNKG